jgi:hypothetical protein
MLLLQWIRPLFFLLGAIFIQMGMTQFPPVIEYFSYGIVYVDDSSGF